jgi:hypothetical protein
MKKLLSLFLTLLVSLALFGAPSLALAGFPYQYDSSTVSTENSDYNKLRHRYQNVGSGFDGSLSTLTVWASHDYSTLSSVDIHAYIQNVTDNVNYYPYGSDSSCGGYGQGVNVATSEKTQVDMSFEYYQTTTLESGTCYSLSTNPIELNPSKNYRIWVYRVGGTGFQVWGSSTDVFANNCILETTNNPACSSVNDLAFSFNGEGPFLGFPLEGLTPYTATISAVMDHHNDNGFNCADNVVTAYTGEQGSNTYDASSWSTTATGSGCSGSLYGWAKASGTFSLGGQYDTSANNEYGEYLFYDGHTGYDYPRNNGTSANAAAGIAYYEGSNNDVKIDHGNGYYTYYLHLQSRTITTDGQSVSKGEEIGTTGSGHLHFTVKKGTIRVDPYGWTGTPTEDPLQIDGHDNTCLWDACP